MTSFPRTVSPIQAPTASTSGETLLAQLYTACAATVVLVGLCCGIYPLAVWAIAQTVFPYQANGSLLTREGARTTDPLKSVGSALLGQSFSGPAYFHGRPSAAGNGYDATASSGSNLGPTSDKLFNGLVTRDEKGGESLAFDGIRLRTLKYAQENDIAFVASLPLEAFKDDVARVKAFPHAGDPADKKPLVLSQFSTPIPADAVTASASGLDPHISPANAAIQTKRVARARHVPPAEVEKLVALYTDRAFAGILGDDGVNVLRLNLALDSLYPAAPEGR